LGISLIISPLAAWHAHQYLSPDPEKFLYRLPTRAHLFYERELLSFPEDVSRLYHLLFHAFFMAFVNVPISTLMLAIGNSALLSTISGQSTWVDQLGVAIPLFSGLMDSVQHVTLGWMSYQSAQPNASALSPFLYDVVVYSNTGYWIFSALTAILLSISLFSFVRRIGRDGRQKAKAE
jgi:hypothetical protein